MTRQEYNREASTHATCNWVEVRNQAAIAAMQGMLSFHGCGLNKDVCAEKAVQFANSLVEEFKKEQ